MTKQIQYPSISLFSGAMGLDLGLEQHGFVPRVAVEINSAAVATIEMNRPELPVLKESIAELSTKEILDAGDLKVGESFLVSAGPCCQSFSTAGSRKSMADPRGNLFFDFCRIVREAKPRFFVMENVKGLLSAAVSHRPLDLRGAGNKPLSKDEELGSAFRLILSELSRLKYHVIFGLFNAADYGVPQKRWRIVFIGSRDGESITLPDATHCAPRLVKDLGLKPWVTLRQALADVEAEEWVEFSDDKVDLLERLKAGQNWRDLPKKMQRKALGAAADSWGGRSGFCRRLSWNAPSPTLTTAPDGRATTLCHPTEVRPLSVEEYKALQQFPENWAISGSMRQQYQQLGNAVPVGLGVTVGATLIETIRRTAKQGLPEDHAKRKGLVICGQAHLAETIANRKRTQLHPPRLRKNESPAANRKWLAATAS
jgi:DNA (cytosine-5)-methyltransferase 1